MTECKGLHFCQGLPNWFAVLLQPSLKTLDHWTKNADHAIMNKASYKVQPPTRLPSLRKVSNRSRPYLRNGTVKSPKGVS